MESPLLGLVLDSSAVIGAERNRQTVAAFIEAILLRHGPVDLGLSPVSVAELVHGVYRAKTPEASQRRREYIEEIVNLVPVHPATNRTAWLVGQIEGQEAAKGNVLPFNDLMIAAAALEQGYAVLTRNIRHFQRIPGLRVVSL
jgi:tRNA(fMet)-specific endonuclease VapC